MSHATLFDLSHWRWALTAAFHITWLGDASAEALVFVDRRLEAFPRARLGSRSSERALEVR